MLETILLTRCKDYRKCLHKNIKRQNYTIQYTFTIPGMFGRLS